MRNMTVKKLCHQEFDLQRIEDRVQQELSAMLIARSTTRA
jgi:hypothetical protein